LRVIRNTFRCRSSQKGSSYQVRITYWQRSSVLDIDTGKITHIYILARARKKVLLLCETLVTLEVGEAGTGLVATTHPVSSFVESIVEGAMKATTSEWNWKT